MSVLEKYRNFFEAKSAGEIVYFGDAASTESFIECPFPLRNLMEQYLLRNSIRFERVDEDRKTNANPDGACIYKLAWRDIGEMTSTIIAFAKSHNIKFSTGFEEGAWLRLIVHEPPLKRDIILAVILLLLLYVIFFQMFYLFLASLVMIYWLPLLAILVFLFWAVFKFR